MNYKRTIFKTMLLNIGLPDNKMVDGFCPKCGSPLTSVKFLNKSYIVCTNRLCDYYAVENNNNFQTKI